MDEGLIGILIMLLCLPVAAVTLAPLIELLMDYIDWKRKNNENNACILHRIGVEHT